MMLERCALKQADAREEWNRRLVLHLQNSMKEKVFDQKRKKVFEKIVDKRISLRIWNCSFRSTDYEMNQARE